VLWYVEASSDCEVEARAAVRQAEQRYEAAFSKASQGRRDLAGVIVHLGAPTVAAVAELAHHRPARGPWWRRIGADPGPARAISETRPAAGDYGHDEIHCLNDPAAAISFWRRDWQSVSVAR
jgi:hypothetical protein